MRLDTAVSSKRHFRWLAIISASQALLDAAKQAKWTDLPLQAEYRDKLIREYFSSPITVDNALELQGQIKQILAMDEQILGLARKEQEGTQLLLRSLTKGASAIKAYQA